MVCVGCLVGLFSCRGGSCDGCGCDAICASLLDDFNSPSTLSSSSLISKEPSLPRRVDLARLALKSVEILRSSGPPCQSSVSISTSPTRSVIETFNFSSSPIINALSVIFSGRTTSDFDDLLDCFGGPQAGLGCLVNDFPPQQNHKCKTKVGLVFLVLLGLACVFEAPALVTAPKSGK